MDILSGLPSNYRKLPATKQLSLKDAVIIGKEMALPLVKPATLNGYVGRLSAMLSFAVREGYISMNPAAGLSVIDPVPESLKRFPFSVAQLQRIFMQTPWNPRKTEGGHFPARFWLPLLGLYTGARAGELAQLLLSDIETLDGVAVIRIRPGADKRLKNLHSERDIPVHDELIKFGFLAFVESQRKVGERRLFPAEKPDRFGHCGRSTGDWFARLLAKNGMIETEYVFHSLRHNFEDRLREADLHGTPIAARLCGRTAGGVAGNYGSGYSAKKLADAIAKVSYPGLDLSWLYTC